MAVETNNSQDIVHTTSPVATVIKVTFDILLLFVPNFIPSPGTQVFFKESKKLYIIFRFFDY